MIITEEMLDALRRQVSEGMSLRRFVHTAEVEKMAAYLGSIYEPDKIPLLRAAALLHDVTKEYPQETQIELCREYGVELEADAYFAPKTLHARTAAAIIPDKFPSFADAEIISCVRYHTTGRADMTLSEKLIYLADYIDMSRTFEDCVKLRNYFLGAEPEKLSESERLSHLNNTLILSFDMTLRILAEEGTPISLDTMAARNQLIRERLAK